MSTTWDCGKNGPTTVEALRAALKKKISGKTGKALIAPKFTKDHLYVGHKGDTTKLARKLAGLRELPYSTLLISSIDAVTAEEVGNWIDKVPAGKLTFAQGVWTISTVDSTVEMLNTYTFATIDFAKLKKMNGDDLLKKQRHYMTISQKTPKLACQFADDGSGTPQIYHLDW